MKKILGSALALGLGLTMAAGGVAMADPGDLGDGNINPETASSLTIHKYSGAPVSGPANDGTEVTVPTGEDDPNKPLAGVSFKACEVTGLDVHKPGDWPTITALNTAINASAKHDFPTTGFDGVSVSTTDCLEGPTDENGEIKWKSTDTNPLKQAVYYVTETGAPANVAEHTLPFLVTVPMAHNTDNTWIYDVNVYPKNALVDIQKAATDAGSVGVGSDVTWTVTNKIPKIQNTFDNYRLRDVLDSRLDYVADSSVVTIDGVTDNQLDADDYTVTNTSGTLLVTFNTTGLTKLRANQEEDLVWAFKTTVKTIGNGVIKNQASVLANTANTVSPDWSGAATSASTVSSNWGALKINKYNGATRDDQKALWCHLPGVWLCG